MSTSFTAAEAGSTVQWACENATPPLEIPQIMADSAAAGEYWRRTDPEERIAIVKAFGNHLSENRGEVERLIATEVSKLPWDAAGEVTAAIAKIDLSIDAFLNRRSKQNISATAGGPSRVVRYQPLGVALVLGPFNFPLHLPGGQIIPALLAGNSVVFKPSEQATAVGLWIQSAWRHAGLPERVLQTIVGGSDVAVAAIDAPETKAVFLTGSRAAGHAIHRQLAGRPGVLLALELGGHNPIVVADPCDAVQAAEVVSFSAFVSAGQRCTCARRAIYVGGDAVTNRGIEHLVQRTKSLTTGLPSDKDAAEVGPLVSVSAAESLHRTYQRLRELGCNDLLPWQVDSRHAALVRPTIVDATKISDEAKVILGEMEWFGPLLVVERASDFDTAVESAALHALWTGGVAAGWRGNHVRDVCRPHRCRRGQLERAHDRRGRCDAVRWTRGQRQPSPGRLSCDRFLQRSGRLVGIAVDCQRKSMEHHR